MLILELIAIFIIIFLGVKFFRTGTLTIGNIVLLSIALWVLKPAPKEEKKELKPL